jgi:hydrophobic/amphiphilic exporter-1 (mainly G- bacteria), HAE1 family
MLGVTALDVGTALRDLVQGNTISSYDLNDKTYDIVIRLNEQDRSSVDDIRNMVITTRTGKKVPLVSIATFNDSAAPLEIRRENNQRIIRVTANLVKGYSLSDVVKRITEGIQKKVVFPSGYFYQFSGQQKMFIDLATQMLLAIFLALIFMYMILASLYNSFIQPLILMMSIPLAMIGAFLALLVTGVDLDIYGYIGILLVIGLVAKNAILLIDFTNKQREEGKSIRDSLLYAGPIRLRPILMTSFAIIFGMLPLALGLNEGSRGRQALPVSVIGGILTSTFMTLVVVPVVYEGMERYLERRRKRKLGFKVK